MTMSHRDRRSVDAAIEHCDFWRRSPASVGGPGGHKEWSYFCLLGDECQLVTAFSIMDRRTHAATGPDGVEEAHVIVLVRTPSSGWTCGLDTCTRDSVAIRAGRVDGRFGSHALAFRGGRYTVDLDMDDPRLGATLSLRPCARPALTRSIPLGHATPMQWFVVPRLEATGVVRVGSRSHEVRACPAYHDHNWGRFRWGGDFAWEWGVAVSATVDGWSLIYYRITDRGRHAVVSQGLLLWQGADHGRTFRDGDLSVRGHGLLRTAGCPRVPRVMHLAVMGSAGDLPRRLEASARHGRDAVDVAFDLETPARIFVPDDDGDEGVTSISECPATATVRGRIDGAAVAFTCHSVVEFNRGAA